MLTLRLLRFARNDMEEGAPNEEGEADPDDVRVVALSDVGNPNSSNRACCRSTATEDRSPSRRLSMAAPIMPMATASPWRKL